MTQNNENAMCLVRRDDLRVFINPNYYTAEVLAGCKAVAKKALTNPVPDNQGWRTDFESDKAYLNGMKSGYRMGVLGQEDNYRKSCLAYQSAIESYRKEQPPEATCDTNNTQKIVI